MASLARLGLQSVRPFIANRGALSVPFVRNAAYWNKDWKPGPFPKTPAERAAAAKKYGLKEEDYEPYADDGMGYGDYPKLPHQSMESRDPYYPWDIPELRRNYGEPMHVDADAMVADKWDPNAKYRFSFTYMHMWFIAVFGGAVAVYLLLEPYPHIHPVMSKQFPADGRKHYTFEPAD